MNQHLEDGALVALMDEPDGQARDHVDDCVTCRGRLRTLERRSRALSALLELTDAESGGPTYDADFLKRMGGDDVAALGKRPTPTLRWAAVLVLIAAGVAAPPVRAFVSDTLRSLWSVVSGADAPRVEPIPVDDPQVAPGASAEVSTVLTGSVLRVTLSGIAAPSAAVRLLGAEGPQALARLRSDGAAGEILVMADGFQIQDPGPSTVIEVEVPTGVTEVVVEMEGGASTTLRWPFDFPVVVSAPGSTP